MTLPLETTRAARTRAAQNQLVEAIRDAAPGTPETDWLEWKSTLDLTARDTRAVIAKAVLGFSNRDPDVARRNMEGVAYLLVGVSEGSVSGVERVDTAKLEAQVETYTGAGPDWRATYADVDGKSVLVVTVEPPDWGDPAHPLRKTFNDGKTQMQEGAIYVRHQASTEVASPADVDMLSRRTARTPGDELTVTVRPEPGSAISRPDIRLETLQAFAENEERRLIQPLEAEPPPPYSLLLAATAFDAEYRKPEDYRERVDEYVNQLSGIALIKSLKARGVLHDVGRLDLEIVNETEAPFPGVQVKLVLPQSVEVIPWQDDAYEEGQLPEPPVPYGEGSRTGSRFASLGRIPMPDVSRIVRPFWVPDVERRSDGTRVVFDNEDVRPHDRRSLPSLWLLLDDDVSSVKVSWEAASNQVRRRLRGEFEVPVLDELVSLDELLAEPPDDDD